MALTVAYQMDHIERINIRGDSTFALLLEGERRGHRQLHYTPDRLAMRALAAELNRGYAPPDDWTGGRVTFSSPNPKVVTGTKESWTLTCLDANGRVKATHQVTVDRGQRAQVGNACTRSK